MPSSTKPSLRLAADQLAANLAALPPRVFTRHHVTGHTILIVRGEAGFQPVTSHRSRHDLNAELPQPPTPAQISAMQIGSMFGWDVPGAHPDHHINTSPEAV